MSQALPPASFTSLIQMLATQAMVAMGKIPLPGQDQPQIQLEAAKHFIDLFDVLEAKTKNNLSAEESGLLSSVAYELRSAYLEVSRKA